MTTKTELKGLELVELSLVDDPANEEANVTIFKSKRDPESSDSQVETVEKALYDSTVEEKETLEKSLESVTSDLTDAEAKVEMLTKALDTEGYDVTEDSIVKRVEPEFIEVEGESIEKSKVPSVILKKLEADAAELAEVEITKRIEATMPNVEEKHARILLKSLDSLEASEVEGFMSFLNAMDKMFADEMEEIGKNADTTTDDPKVQLDDMVKAKQEEMEGTFEQAYAEIAKTSEGAALINKSYNK